MNTPQTQPTMDISTRIATKYAHALTTGALKLTDTVAQRVTAPGSGIPCVVSFAPSLANKPERPRTSKTVVRPDPFADPCEDLTVLRDLRGDGQYMLLLNKFPVIPEHVLVVTREYRTQTELLDAADLAAAHSLVTQLDTQTPGSRHVAFYNCGPASGSSQDHKHLQLFRLPAGFVPYQERQLNPQESSISPPFAHVTVPLPLQPSGDHLASLYNSSLGTACGASTPSANSAKTQEADATTAAGPAPSHNVLLTRTFMTVVPRSAASTTVTDARGRAHVLGVNATGYLGLLLCKSDETYTALCAEPSLIDQALRQCAHPPL
ncbi:hypothetical protein DAKH74_047080 [Maudiozyma humilis]|uniref:Uncharacterized protein n=1 Tax=Maudiozyma humilis TaxID=51915 RepID=A0AAV5S4B5_MAUHU|nr:hypothetical protein DAKH74_047080 [Kazachstania humilis]